MKMQGGLLPKQGSHNFRIVLAGFCRGENLFNSKSEYKGHYLSVSGGTIRIMSFGSNSRALLINLLAKAAFSPKGGLRPMICTRSKQKK